MLPFLAFVVQLSIVDAVLAYAILEQQCWHEHPFSTVNLYSSSSNRRHEYVSILHNWQLRDKLGDINTGIHAPWSYPPVCTEILQSITEKLCVYTSTSFGYGRGISIFTTPSLAERFTSLPAFKDPSALAAQHINTDSSTWQATPILGKGIGMLASKPLNFKDRVTAYTPAFLAYLETELSTLDREAWWKLAIEQLPEKTKADFMNLTYVFGDVRIRVQDIVKANTFQVDVEGVNHLAIFPETSRLNHACNPNAQYVINTELLTHFVHVTRPIVEGEEITISYISPLDAVEIRQQQLKSGFHFTCTCPRCTSSSNSDRILETIKSLQNQLNDWSPSSTGSPETAKQLMKLHRDEGLEGFMDVAYGFAALAYNAVGDSKKAVLFAEKAREAILMKDGKWAPNLRLWNEVLADPKEHWSHKRRL